MGDWIHPDRGKETRQGRGSLCEYGNKPSGSIKCGNFLTRWGNIRFSKPSLLQEVSKNVCMYVRWLVGSLVSWLISQWVSEWVSQPASQTALHRLSATLYVFLLNYYLLKLHVNTSTKTPEDTFQILIFHSVTNIQTRYCHQCSCSSSESAERISIKFSFNNLR